MTYYVYHDRPDGTSELLCPARTEPEAFREAEFHGKRLGINPVIRREIVNDRQALIDLTIIAYNSNSERPFDEIGGVRSYHRARRPILATDCDYEIVSISGVQGKNLQY